MALRFGTDGVRGVAGTELTAALARALGRAAVPVLGGAQWLVGRDTRQSGPWLLDALAEGLTEAGADVVDLGVVPTPAVADLARRAACPAAVISASHNPYTDNGIKLLSAGGRKLSDEEEARIEAGLDAAEGPSPAGSGRRRQAFDQAGDYCALVASVVEGRALAGMRVVIDCANGAAYRTAPAILARTGADLVEVLSAAPDGTNINRACGSTDPSALAAAVVGHGAAAGLAFDGDADRVIAVDERGDLVDGDRLIALFAVDLRQRGLLAGPGVAVTVMTNLGFHRAMEEEGIAVVTTPVGDRHIVSALEERGWSLGGEQSGHIVFREVWPGLAPTGDGVLTGLALLDLLARSGRPLSDLAGGVMRRLPQVLRNVRVADHRSLERAEPVWAEVRAVEAELGDAGRVLIRPSGTEPLVRVMVEAPSEDLAGRSADRLASVVLTTLGRRS